MIQDDRSGGDGVGHADHRVQRGHPQRRGSSLGVASGGPGDRSTEQTRTKTQETPQDQVPETQPQMDVVQGYRPDMEDMQRYQPQMSDPRGFHSQFHVDLNEPAGSPYDS
ncbi:hypothetical protein AHAS_Ahas15G0042200 [Arachis hypogaea]